MNKPDHHRALVDSSLSDPLLIHPGEILKEEFMQPHGLSAYALAKALHVPRNRIESLVRGQRSITPDTALRLARFFGNSAQFWLNLQNAHDFRVTGTAIAEDLAGIDPLAA